MTLPRYSHLQQIEDLKKEIAELKREIEVLNADRSRLQEKLNVSFGEKIIIEKEHIPGQISAVDETSSLSDITRRKKAEEALHASEAQLDAFFANSPAILNLVDENFCYVNSDRLTPTYYGLNRETIKGKCLQDLSRDFMEQTGVVISGNIVKGLRVFSNVS